MCARNEGSDCPICQGVELPEDLVSLIGQAGAAAPSAHDRRSVHRMASGYLIGIIAALGGMIQRLR
jgi:hypothetical protein